MTRLLGTTRYRLQSGDRLMLLSNEDDMEALGRTKEGAVPAVKEASQT